MSRNLLTVAVVVGAAIAIGACGASHATHGPAAAESDFVAFSKCMRARGVTNFPDPSPDGGGIELGGNINPQSPAFVAARKSCSKLLPGGGPGSQHASESDKLQMLDISRCMRRHGAPGFPDPTLAAPSDPNAYHAIENRGGVVLAIPDTIDVNAPAFVHAASVCGFS